MLRWSDEPLEIFLDDPRSPARRLPPAEEAWLERHRRGAARAGRSGRIARSSPRSCSGEAIGRGVHGRGPRAARRASRRRWASGSTSRGCAARRHRRQPRPRRRDGDASGAPPMMECPRCGRCEESGAAACPSDGSPLKPGPASARRRQQVPDRAAARPRRHGRGVPRARHAARSPRRAEGRARRSCSSDPDARRRFRREAQIVARLQHPAIVAVFDFGTLRRAAAPTW